jgi:autoinducer 2 (AI-2) kinase
VSADSILVIDAGTSALRSVLVSGAATRTLGAEPWHTFIPGDGSPFARELDSAAAVLALEQLISRAESERGRIAGIALTGQREGVAFVDAGGTALCVSPNIDGRAAMEGMTIDGRHGSRVYAVTGHLPSLMQAPAKLAWLRANRPDVSARVHRVVPLADWLAGMLTGEQLMSRSLAAEIGLVDIRAMETAAAMLEELDLAPAMLPPAVSEGTLAGKVRSGTLAGIGVVLCGADTQCALVGMGILDEWQAGVAAGWSAPVQTVVATPLVDNEQRTWTGLHVVPSRWVLESNAGDCGRAFAWLCETLSLSVPEADALASSAPPASHDVLAVFGPPVMRAAAMSVTTGGLMMPMPLAMSAPTRPDLLRAVLEGAAYAIRANLEQLEAITGRAATRVALGGGMSASAPFRAILAQVLGRTIDVAASPETTALGAAAIASPAFGLHDTIGEAIEIVAGAMTTQEFDMRASAEYDDHYRRWRATADLLASGAA